MTYEECIESSMKLKHNLFSTVKEFIEAIDKKHPTIEGADFSFISQTAIASLIVQMGLLVVKNAYSSFQPDFYLNGIVFIAKQLATDLYGRDDSREVH